MKTRFRIAAITALAGLVSQVHEAHAMFTNNSSKEMNMKLIYVGPQRSGKVENLQYVYEHTEADAKGKMMSVATDKDKTMFFAIAPKSLGEIRGYRVRFHLYTLAGEEEYDASTALLLKGADGIVFVADCAKDRVEADIEALDRVKAAIRAQGRDWEKLPKVFQLNRSKTHEAIEEVKQALGISKEVVIVADSGTGAGVFDTLKAGAKELLLGLKDGRVTESKASPDERISGDRMTSRVQVVSHYGEFFGEGVHEFGPWHASPKSADFYIMLHPPTKARPYFTYATFGLSTEPQPAGGQEPRVELIAYSEKENATVAQRLATAAMMIASSGPNDTPFKTFDTVDIGEPGSPDAQFALVPPEEAKDFFRFPDEKRQLRDLLFTRAVGAPNDAEAHVTFLKLLPLTVDEAKFATAKGTPALLKKFTGRAKYFGWGRSLKESVLTGAAR